MKEFKGTVSNKAEIETQIVALRMIFAFQTMAKMFLQMFHTLTF